MTKRNPEELSHSEGLAAKVDSRVMQYLVWIAEKCSADDVAMPVWYFLRMAGLI